MKSIGAEELAARIDEVLGMVKQGETVDVIRNGKVVARFVPPEEDEQRDKEEVEAFLKAMHEIAEQIGSEVDEKVDVTEIISEGRRELPISYEHNDAWRNLKRLSIEIGKHWTDGIDAVEAVQDVRRDL